MILEQSSQSAMIEDLTSLLPIVILICVLVICYCFRSLTLGACILVHVVVTAHARLEQSIIWVFHSTTFLSLRR